ncbi:hypothetical protein [Petrocella sp. FN5]|uniref:hypothetical protein n=1 Tax=Petrocella sp. FN5 TaxID=3032002 RepID=UPI0023DC181F|nr:hypothetical protein [Petrocella sp. FN5]MDF1617201.1 hypothetical protein [Petrocella sp. FN5]
MEQISKGLERRQLLERLFELDVKWKQLVETEMSTEEVNLEMEGLVETYLNQLSEVNVSRCPFTGEMMTLRMDVGGIDGLWWNNESPKRPESNLPKTYFAMDGAMKLEAVLEVAPFIVTPGPDLPFVIPRLLAFDQIKAVLSTVKIGAHTGYMMVYYADPMLEGEKRVNDWGTDRYWEETDAFSGMLTPGQWVSVTPSLMDYDFDLAPYIRSGKLLWIEPQDASLQLKSMVKGCPYLELEGSHKLKFIQEGQMWDDDMAFEFEEDALDEGEYMKIIDAIERSEG